MVLSLPHMSTFGEPELVLKQIVVGPLMENVYILGDKGTGECLVIDPGAEGERILQEVRRLGLEVTLVVNTHGHVDHIGAVATVVEATRASYGIHPGDRPLLEAAASSPLRVMLPDFREPPQPDLELAQGQWVQVGSLRLRLLETPGHTPGSVCFYLEGQDGPGMVFTGDTLFRGSIGRYDLPGGDGRLLLQSIREKLLVLPPETRVYPGHGPGSTIGWEKAHNPFLLQDYG